VALVNSNSAVPVTEELRKLCHSVHLRENGGFDWGAWADVLPGLAHLWRRSDCRSVLFTNDSYLAPVFGQESFEEKLRALWARDLDLCGMTISHEVERHIQSYWIEVSVRVLRESRELHRMLVPAELRAMRTVGEVIAQREVAFLRRMLVERPDYRVGALHEAPAGDRSNPYICHYDDRLVPERFPLFKLSVLRLRSSAGHAAWVDVVANKRAVHEWRELDTNRGTV
jgi:lipopolysaccharide biosynthesis protein